VYCGSRLIFERVQGRTVSDTVTSLASSYTYTAKGGQFEATTKPEFRTLTTE
jgi:hypothetical protein